MIQGVRNVWGLDEVLFRKPKYHRLYSVEVLFLLNFTLIGFPFPRNESFLREKYVRNQEQHGTEPTT